MTKATRKRKIDEEDAINSHRFHKRVKAVSNESKGERSNVLEDAKPVQRKLNRLQRAVSLYEGLSRTVTLAQARRVKKAEKQAGILAGLLDAPVDIFCEIVLYISPLDLLNLSRVSHQLRSLLLSKQSRPFWVATLKSDDLPPCPADLNEPQYASLVYDTDCNACGSPHVKSVYYELRVRLCKGCSKLNLLRGVDIIEEFDPRLLKQVIIYDLLPYAGLDIHYISTRVNRAKRFYKPDLIDIATEYSYHYFRGEKGTSEIEEFIAERKRRKSLIIEHAWEIKKWEMKKEKEKQLELLNLEESFKESVEAKLKEIGYTEEDWNFGNDYLYDSTYHSDWLDLTEQQKELTPRIWKSLLPKLEKILKGSKSYVSEMQRQERHDHRRDEFAKAYESYSDKLNLTAGEFELMPYYAELLAYKPVEDLFSFDDCQRIISDDVFSAFIPTLENICYEFKVKVLDEHESVIREIRAIFKKEITDIGESKYISLANSVFPHPSWGLRNRLYYFTASPPAVFGKVNVDGKRQYWQRKTITIPEKLIKIPDALLTSLGLPLNTAMNTVLAMGSRFMCCCCDVVFQKPMTWIELIEHFWTETNSFDQAASLRVGGYGGYGGLMDIPVMADHGMEANAILARVLSDEELARANEVLPSTAPETSVLKSCLFCEVAGVSIPGMSLEQLEVHKRTKHGLITTDPSELK